MAAPLILYLDTTRKTLVSNFGATVYPGAPTLEAGDTVPVQLHFLQLNTNTGQVGAAPYSYIDPATVTPVSMALGEIGAVPSAGTFTATFGANTTGAIAYNATAATVSTALNALASVVSAGGVTVTGAAGGPWTIVFTNTGARTLMTINGAELVPVSQGIVGRSVTGATGVNEQQVITLLQNPAALTTAWTATYGSVTVSSLQTGASGANAIQRVTLPTSSYGGSFSLTFGGKSTGPIAYNTTASALQTALQAIASIGANNCVVIASSATTYDVTFVGTLAGAPQSLMTANSAGLMAPMYLAGTLNLNVQGIFNILGTADAVQLTLQIQQGSGTVNTVLQTPANLNATLIEGSPSVPPLINVYQSGQVAVVAGTTAYPITFSFNNPPSFVTGQLCLAGATAEYIEAFPDLSTLTSTGVTLRLAAAPSSASSGSYIKWFAIP